MFGRKPPDPISVLVASLEQALVAVRLDLAEAIQTAIDLREENGRLEDELALEKSCGARVVRVPQRDLRLDSELRAHLTNLSRRCEASELLAHEIGEAREQLAGERDHARNQRDALKEAIDTLHETAVEISYAPGPGDVPEADMMAPCVKGAGCTSSCDHRGKHMKSGGCKYECRRTGKPCVPVPASPEPPEPAQVICDHAAGCTQDCSRGHHHAPHLRSDLCTPSWCVEAGADVCCVPVAGEEKPT